MRGTRGQLEPQQILLGGFILLMLAGPLIQFWTQFQASLSSMPQFSPVMAALVASLLVLAIIVAALGLD